MPDKRRLHLISASTLAVLLIVLLVLGKYSGRIIAAVLLLPITLICWFGIKKRGILSLNKNQILMLMGVIGALYLSLLYLTGLEFGFVRNPYALKGSFFLSQALPIAVILVTSELFRYVMRAQNDRTADILSYLSCVIAETLILGNLGYISSFNRFMDFVGITLFPAVTANLLYHYLSKRYGYLPNLLYRALTTLYIYFIPIESAIPDSLLAFVKLFLPILIYFFIDALYEKKRRYALVRKSKLSVIITVLSAAIATFVVLLISNQFRFGVLIIGTPSMTGELNKGDAAIFETYDNRTINEGQIIVFEKNDTVIVHRVVDIQTVNGITRYFTKGDANEDTDAGYILNSDILGIVNYKIPYIGYPTLWLRSLFKR